MESMDYELDTSVYSWHATRHAAPQSDIAANVSSCFHDILRAFGYRCISFKRTKQSKPLRCGALGWIGEAIPVW
jgi:hypothetical protein